MASGWGRQGHFLCFLSMFSPCSVKHGLTRKQSVDLKGHVPSIAMGLCTPDIS